MSFDRFRIPSLLFLPLLFIIFSQYFGFAKGEFYLRNYYDPSYAYLFNSLNLAQLKGYGVGHIDHPGTTVQTIGGIILFCLNLTERSNFISNVFEKPEYYLRAINFTFTLMISGSLFLLGWTAIKRTKNLAASMFLQLTPFFSMSIYYRVMNVSPEPILIFTMIIFLSFIFSFAFSQEDQMNRNLKYVIIFGIICGFGIATKISFFPILIIPLFLIKKISNKALFCLITLIAFVFFILPAFSVEHAWQFKNWIKKLILYSGKYGGGERNVVNYSSIPENLISIIVNEPVFVISFLFGGVTSLAIILSKLKRKQNLTKIQTLMIALFVAMVLQIMLVTKHFELHYLIPSYLLTIPALFTIYFVLSRSYPRTFKKGMKISLTLLFLILFVLQVYELLKLRHNLVSLRDAARSVIQITDDQKADDVLIVSSYGVSNREYGLFLGTHFSGTQKENNYKELNKLFPNSCYWDYFSKSLNNTRNIDEIRKDLISKRKVIFICNNEKILFDFIQFVKDLTGVQNISSENLHSTFSGENVFRILLN